jgi:hypothetical protein
MQAHREAVLPEYLPVWLKRGRGNRERALATDLTKAGYNPVAIAAAALKLRPKEKQRPVAPHPLYLGGTRL